MVTVPILGTDLRPMDPNPSLLVEMSRDIRVSQVLLHALLLYGEEIEKAVMSIHVHVPCDFLALRFLYLSSVWKSPLGPVYTKHQRQRCDHSAMTLVILFSLKLMETLENGLQTHSGASSQSCRSVDADVWCKRVL